MRKNAELPAILIGYKGVRIEDPDRPTLDVAARILAGGESARLRLDMVRTTEVATGVYADLNWGIDPELFIIYAQAKPGKTADDLIARVDEGIAALGRGPVSPEELARAKRQLRMELLKGLKTVGGKANQLGFFEVVFGGHGKIDELEAQWNAVTPEDVQRVVTKYLVPAQRTRAILQPVAAEPPAPPQAAPAGTGAAQ